MSSSWGILSFHVMRGNDYISLRVSGGTSFSFSYFVAAQLLDYAHLFDSVASQ